MQNTILHAQKASLSQIISGEGDCENDGLTYDGTDARGKAVGDQWFIYADARSVVDVSKSLCCGLVVVSKQAGAQIARQIDRLRRR